MGYYINATKKGSIGTYGKAQRLIDDEGAQILPAAPKSFAEIPDGFTCITVVDNGRFEAAGVLYDEDEFNDWVQAESGDNRPRRYLLMEKKRAFELSGVNG